MGRSEYWAKPKIVREQATLFSPTLDDVVSADHEVRLLDELLRNLDWSEWEAHFPGGRGQPPIHPRVLAGVWLYAMMRRIRTSRPVEYACRHNVDFMWLVEGLTPDHSTLADFFSRFHKELKSLFKKVCRIALRMGLIRLGEVGFDGTRVRACNGRHQTLKTPTLEERLQAVDAQIERIMSEVAAAEAAAGELRGGEPVTKLPPELADLTVRREKLSAALKIAKSLDETRRAEGTDIKKNPAQVPITDLDSRVMPNKEGGYAPNYTPTCLTDGQNGFILDATVLNIVNEHPETLPAVDRTAEMCGRQPEKFMADTGMATGPIMAGLEERKIVGYLPVKSNEPSVDSPVRRDDLTVPVPEHQWDQLPRNAQGQLDKSCFVYVPERDEYVCPNGRTLPYESRETRDGVMSYRYKSSSCDGCPLMALCLSPSKKETPEKSSRVRKQVRSIRRDEHEGVRQRMALHMQAEGSQEQFNRRSHIAETPFAYLKGVFGLRQFRHIGLEKVEHEWRWSCLSLNVKKLVRAIQREKQSWIDLLSGNLGEMGPQTA